MKKLISLLLALVLCMSLCAAAFADVYTDAGFIKKIPMKPKYTEAVENHGTVEILNYTCHSYALEAMASGDFAVSEAADGNTQLPEIPDGLLPAAVSIRQRRRRQREEHAQQHRAQKEHLSHGLLLSHPDRL